MSPLPNRRQGNQNDSHHIGFIRRTQLITTFGSGAIAAMPDYSVTISAPEFWRKKYSQKISEPHLERLLHVHYFKTPPITGDDSVKAYKQFCIPTFRFPTIHYCPKCHRLLPYEEFAGQKDVPKATKECGNPNCNHRKLIPSRFIVACVNGHLEDFPYLWWVHHGKNHQCSLRDLRIEFRDNSGGLDSILISCKKCGARRTMSGCMSEGALNGYHCTGKRPWLGPKDSDDPVECEATMRCLQRGASNVYFPITASALTIPPFKDELNEVLASNRSKIMQQKRQIAQFPESSRKSILSIVLQGYADISAFNHSHPQYSFEKIAEIVEDWQPGNVDQEQDYTKKSLYEDEFRVLSGASYNNSNDTYFHTERADVCTFLDGYVSDVVIVKRLREVLALKGFRRIFPDPPPMNISAENPTSERFHGYHYAGDCIPLGFDDSPTWLPAIELLGEGIFIKLDEGKVRQWESNQRRRYDAMGERLSGGHLHCENFSPRYVLLHTLSHILIRQLTIECGYSGASIKERIYSTYPDSDLPMAGILLYTSSPDSDGSLGGLARNGYSQNFENIFRGMLQAASWCSSDPICIESKAQGYESLNYAACHACTLLPETSCEMRNCLLDRYAVVGSMNNHQGGYFGSLL